MRVLGIIPARGGSKGVLKKNIRQVDGLPLIAYSIIAGQQSELLSELVVATDSEEIIEVAKNYNQNYFKRSPESAQDTSPVEAVVKETLASLDKDFDIIVLLQPTAPIRESEDIDNVIQMFKDDPSLESVVSVVALEDIHPARMYKIDTDFKMIPLQPENERERRQNLDPVYIRNGAIYAIRVQEFLKTNKLISTNKKAYVMPESKWANVDTERDLLITEVLISEWKKGNL